MWKFRNVKLQALHSSHLVFVFRICLRYLLLVHLLYPSSWFRYQIHEHGFYLSYTRNRFQIKLSVDCWHGGRKKSGTQTRGNSRKPHKRKSNFDCSVFILHLFFFFFCVCRLETRYLCTSPQDKHIFSNNFAHLPWLDIWYALKACDTLFSLFSACEYESLVL